LFCSQTGVVLFLWGQSVLRAIQKPFRKFTAHEIGAKWNKREKFLLFNEKAGKYYTDCSREREKRRMELELRLFTQRSNPVSAAALSCAPNLRPTKCSHDKEINCFARCLLIPEQQQQPAYLRKSRLLSAPSARSLK
jgi:hypothetical protein